MLFILTWVFIHHDCCGLLFGVPGRESDSPHRLLSLPLEDILQEKNNNNEWDIKNDEIHYNEGIEE